MAEVTFGAKIRRDERMSTWSVITQFLIWGGLIGVVIGAIYAIWFWLPTTRPLLAELLILIAILGVYPTAYLAYLRSGAEAKRERLREDFRLFGLVSDEDLDDTINKLYRNIYSGPQFISYILLIVAISTFILWAFLNKDAIAVSGLITPRIVDLVFYGYLGAYVFSVQELIRRYNTFDLQPQVYSSILSRILVTAAISYLFGAILVANQERAVVTIGNQDPLVASALEIAVVFTIGVFPTIGVRWMIQQAQRVLNTSGQQNFELPLSNLLGISTWHEARLSTMGIDNAQNLATVDLPRILLTTQFDTPQVANWIDQAILYVKVGTRIDRFREVKITTFSELLASFTDWQQSLPKRSDLGAPGSDGNGVVNQDPRASLATLLGLSSLDEFRRLIDYSNYPNYNYIAHYYEGAARLGRQRAEVSVQRLTGSGSLDRKFFATLAMADDDTDLVTEMQRLKRQQCGVRNDPQLLTKLGIVSYLLGKKQEAADYFDAALKIDRNYAEAYYGRSIVHLDQMNIPQALRDVTKAINLRPGYAEAYNHRGSIYLQDGAYTRALRDLDRAVELDPRLAVAYYNRAIAYNARGQLKEAMQELEKAYLLGYNQAGLWYVWGLVLLSVDELAGAIEKFTEAIFRNPKLADAYVNRGNAYLRLGGEYIEQANNDFLEAIKLDSRLAEPHNKLGNIAFGRRKYKEAIEHYEMALTKDPFHVNALLNQSSAYIELGDYEQVSRIFRKVSRLVEQGRLSPEQLERFEQLAEFLGLSNRVLENLREALELSRSIEGNEIGIAYALEQIGRLYAQRGDLITAKPYLDEAKQRYIDQSQPIKAQEIEIWLTKLEACIHAEQA